MKERLNVKNITLNETADELAYKGIKESTSIKSLGRWELGKGYKKPFNKFLEYTTKVDKHEDTNRFIENLNLKGNECKLQEGAGAGYDLKLFEINVENVVLNKVYKNNIGVQTADFEADIVPGNYHWYASGYDWSVDSRDTNYYDDFEFDVDRVPVWGKVWGTWENPIQNFQDENAEDYPEDAIKEEIQSESFDLGDSLSWGWVHSDIPAKWDIEEEVGREDHYDKPIDLTDESDRYKFSYISKASLEFPEVDLMNSYVNQAMYPEDYFGDAAEGADTYEDYLYYANKTNGTPMSKEEWENVTGIKEDPQLELQFGESKKRVREFKSFSYSRSMDEVFRALDKLGVNFNEEYPDYFGDGENGYMFTYDTPKGYLWFVVNDRNGKFVLDIMETIEEDKQTYDVDTFGNLSLEDLIKEVKSYISEYEESIRKVESKIREKNSGTVEVLLYFKNPVERQKALDFLKGKMDAYKFDDYYSYDFKGAVTKGALDRGVVVYGSYNGKIADEALDIINYVKEICPYEVVDSTYVRAIDESKKRVKEFYTPSPNKEKYWKDPNHPQARAERDWWLHRVRTSKNNIWENDGAFDFADHDAKESLRKFGKIYVDPETGKPVEPNYVRNLIDEWGDKE